MGTRRHPRRPRLFVFARHAESSANLEGLLSSDPARAVGLTARGRTQARQLGAQLTNFDIDLAVCSCFLRTRQTLELALRDRPVPVRSDAGFDEIRAGEFDGQPIGAYWSWEQHHTGSERFPHGESVDEALLRYANALRRLLSRRETVTLLVIHEFALHHIAAAATTSSSRSFHPSFPNALPYLFGERAIERAADGLEASARSDMTGHRAMSFSPRGDLDGAPHASGCSIQQQVELPHREAEPTVLNGRAAPNPRTARIR
jgi:broad specificity phosphatase PhoE